MKKIITFISNFIIELFSLIVEILRHTIIRLLTLPLLILEMVLSLVFLVTHRAMERGRKIHIKLEYLEKYRNKKRRDKLKRRNKLKRNR